jgi:hypothetical protein
VPSLVFAGASDDVDASFDVDTSRGGVASCEVDASLGSVGGAGSGSDEHALIRNVET